MRLLFSCLLWCLLPGLLWAQAPPSPYVLLQLTGPVTLDGRSDEAAWQAIEPLPLAMYEPTFRGAMTERTEIRVAYDANSLYVAGRMYAEDPASIRVNSLTRDRYSGDDVIGIIIDPFNDNENGLWFFANPAGTRFDIGIGNDADFSNGNVLNESWNTYWDAAAVQTADGWFVEARIPFSSLGFQTTGGAAVMGLTVYRYIAAKNERHIFPAIEPNYFLGNAKPSQAQDVLLTHVISRRPLYLTPYALGGTSRSARLNEAQSGYGYARATTTEVGADLKYNVTSNLTLDLTANTDFAQVEADDQQVNLSRFSLFFPEKRQFFQERSGLFDFNFGGVDRLFHSRQIGLDPRAEPVRIYGGARLTGRIGAWDIGLLEMQTADSELLPAENMGVVRLRRQALNPNSYFGAMLTSRASFSGDYNFAYGLDGVVNVVGSDYLTLQWAQTFDDALLERRNDRLRNAARLRVDWNHRALRGWRYRASFSWSGVDYQPDLGFLTRRDFFQPAATVGYGHFPAGGPFQWVNLSLWTSRAMRNRDQSVETAAYGSTINLQRRSGTSIWINPQIGYQDLRFFPLRFGDTEVPLGNYTFAFVAGNWMMGDARRIRVNGQFNGGGFYDGSRFSLSLSPIWNVSKHLELGGTYQINHVRFPERDQVFTGHIGRVRVQWARNARFSASAFLQYSNLADVIVANLRLRYNFRENSDLWLVYNEGLNTVDTRSGLAVPFSAARTLLVKYTYTFTR